MDWRDLSYAYIFSCITDKKLIPGLEKCLHPDAQKAYLLIPAVIQKYKQWPTPDHFKDKFNLEYKHYYKEGWTQAELSERLKDQYYKDITQDLTADLQNISVTNSLVSAEDISNLISSFSDKLNVGDTSSGESIRNASKILSQYRNRQEHRVCGFGFPSLDAYTGGITKAQYTIIYGSISEGKSTFSRKLAANMAMGGAKVLYLSLEETAEDSIVLASSVAAEFNGMEVFDGKVSADTDRRVNRMCKTIAESGGDLIFVDKVESKSYEGLLALKNEFEPDVLFLDQITLFTPNGSSEEKDITRVTRMLKSFCHDQQFPIVALTQQLRGSGKKANLDHIGYAASIGQDADLVLYVHPTDEDEGIYRKKVTIVKNRKRQRNIELNFNWVLKQGMISEQNSYMSTVEDVLDET